MPSSRAISRMVVASIPRRAINFQVTAMISARRRLWSTSFGIARPDPLHEREDSRPLRRLAETS